MGRPELGTKCACASCAERFYDLNRSLAVCPKCGAPQPPISVRAARPGRTNYASAHMSRRPTPAVAEEAAEPLATAEKEVDEDEDGDEDTNVPEIEADEDTIEDPVIVRD